MATYKVIQDVEAEDKILGPLTLRQFIYAGITAGLLYLCYFVATHGLGVMVALFFPIAAVFGFFAFPWGRDQPTEVWALAKIRFLLKPRKRLWDQSGAKELVTITAPKQVQEISTNRLSQTEVKSRLHALADTIDSRGWAIKNATLNTAGTYGLMLQQPISSDRLLDVPAPTPQSYPTDVRPADDMLDEKANPGARRVDSMITASAQAHRQKLLNELKSSAPQQSSPAKPDYWFLNQSAQPVSAPSGTVTFNTQVVAPGASDTPLATPPPALPTEDEEALVHELAARKEQGPTSSYYGHLRTIKPLAEQRAQAAREAATAAHRQAAQAAKPQATPPVTPAQQAAILQLASNDDLNVATIAREANRSEANNEVVIKLH